MREQLITAIEEDPDDIENYRVDAEWLEANNQPRGQLITMERPPTTEVGHRLLREHVATTVEENAP